MSAAQGEQRDPFGQMNQKQREKMKNVESVHSFIYLLGFFLSSLTKNGIDHSHHDVQRGRYVGAECSIFICRCHLQTKEPSGDELKAPYHKSTQVISGDFKKERKWAINWYWYGQSCGKSVFGFTQGKMNTSLRKGKDGLLCDVST